jgi:hypothetical protein
MGSEHGIMRVLNRQCIYHGQVCMHFCFGDCFAETFYRVGMLYACTYEVCTFWLTVKVASARRYTHRC